MYCFAFSLAIFVYLWGWSDIFPELSAGLILFFALTFVLFIFAGYILSKKKVVFLNRYSSYRYINDIIFGLIILLGILNVIYMGYLPVLDRSHNYREFGMPVIDTIFNTLSIFFSIFLFQYYLENKKRRFLIYVFIILIFQILLFRRATFVWIITASFFLYLFYKQRINLLVILVCFICIPLFSYCFGLYGNERSGITRSRVMNEFGVSDAFKTSGINHNHYMTYLYVASPLANLQKNIDEGNGFFNNAYIKDFIFYCLIPVSFTIRLEKPLGLTEPVCNLITPALIVGSFYMVSFYTLGWAGMIIMLLFLFLFIVLCLYLIKKWNTFGPATYAILTTTVSLLIFSNFLNRLDVILILFVYPLLFHIIYTPGSKVT